MNPQVQREDCPVVPQSGHRTRTQGSKRTISWPVQVYNHGPHTSLPVMYSQFSQILPLCQHWKLTSLKPYKNNYQLDQWDDMTHCTPIQVLASTKKREAKKESVVGSTRDTSVGISGNLEITSQDSSPPFTGISWETFHTSLHLPVFQPPNCPGLPSACRHLGGTHTKADTPLDWLCINRIKLYNKFKNINWRLKLRTFEITVLPCATVLMSEEEHKSAWNHSSSSMLMSQVTWHPFFQWNWKINLFVRLQLYIFCIFRV